MLRVGLAVLILAAGMTLAVACSSSTSTGPVFRQQPLAESAPTETALPVASLEPMATPEPTATPPPSPTPRPTATLSPVPAPTRAVPEGRPIAVVVENELAGRPPIGLGEADVIYEAIAEWNLTRFVAVFADSSVDTVGPVRSGRAYHGAIAAEYEAALAHCLDVPSLPGVIAATKAVNIDGCRMTDPPGFWRDWNKRMPHNLFVSVPVLRTAAGGSGTYAGFGQRQPWPAATDPVDRISFVYPEDHPVTWRYDPGRRDYLRWQDGAAHVDAGGRQIAASALIVQFVPVQRTTYFGEAGYHELTLTGKGEAILYAAGDKRLATWRRDTLTDPTLFYDQQGQRILLPPGRVFVELLAIGTAVDEKS